MEKHVKLTEGRILRFIGNLWKEIYEEKFPLSAKFTHCVDPIPFKSLGSRKWKDIKQGMRWGCSWDSAWFRFKGVVPKKWKGCEVMAFIDTASEACIFDESGNPVAGLTGNNVPHPPGQSFVKKVLFPVTTRSNGNEHVNLLVEAAANEFLGSGRECFLLDASLVKFNRRKWDLFHDIFFLNGLMLGLPEDHYRRTQIMYVLNEVVNLYDGNSRKNILESRKVMKSVLEKRANASAPLVSAIGHSHIDTAWMWPLRETVRKVGRTFSSALKYMEEYPDYKFGASQPQLYEFAKIHYPGLYKKIKKAVKDGRWEVQGGMWVEPDCNVPSGESLVRQFLYGKRFFMKEFGIEADNLWIPDVFGYPAALPQIMKKAGVDYFLTQKLSSSQFDTYPNHTFMWEGIDGTSVFTHFPPANTYCANFMPEKLISAAKNFLEKDRANRWIHLFGIGDGGGGPSRHDLELEKRARNCEELPKIKQEFARDFFRKAAADIKDIPVWTGELYYEKHRGTYTSQARSKYTNRKSELLLRETEWLRSFNTRDYPHTELDRLWKLVLLNQFHDILPGTSIAWVYKDSHEQYRDVLSTGKKLLAYGGKSLSLKIDTRGRGTPVIVTNSLSWRRNDIFSIRLRSKSDDINLKDAAGSEIPFQIIKDEEGKKMLCKAELPSMGYSVFFISKGSGGFKNNLRTSIDLIENELFRVELNKAGFIIRIFDKENNREVMPEGTKANVLALYDECDENAWETEIYYEEKKPHLPVLIKSEVVERGPVRVGIRQRWEISEKSSLVQEIRLASGSRRLEFYTKVDWHENEKMLRASFPVKVHSLDANYEIQFGHIKRSTHRNTSWDMAKFEVCAHKWADLSERDYGVALLNDCKYGYKIHKNVISMSLLRSPKYPDPQADMGSHVFTYALYPHQGDLIEGEVIKEGYELNVPARSFATGKHYGQMPRVYSSFNVDSDSVIIDTVKKAEDSNAIIVRLYEASGCRRPVKLTTALPVKKAMLTDLLERDIKQISCKNRRIRFNIKPFEIVTLKLS